jgi:hypothetical protein
MLLLGPLSVAYLKGNYERAPWLMPHVAPPGGKRLPAREFLQGLAIQPGQRFASRA